jgi:manganese oxidase
MRRRLRWGLGALALSALAACPAATPQRAPAAGRTIEYWIAAVPLNWNVVPNSRDAIGGERFELADTTFKAVAYRAYTPHWRRRLPVDPHRGIVGPLIRARVGDRIVVHFKNLDTFYKRPHSMHFHGVRYPFGSDGSYIPGFSTRGGAVKPGRTFTYRLVAVSGSAGVWPYHDHSPSMEDSIPGGLYGALSILAPGEKPPDREFVVYFEMQRDLMTINGRAFVGNTPVLRARVGDVVQWDVLALGDDHHTFHLHGHRWRNLDGSTIDTRVIGPAESFSFRIREDVPGTWLYHCHVEEHMAKGMIGIYRAMPR